MAADDKTVILVNTRQFSESAAFNIKKIASGGQCSKMLIVYFNSRPPASFDPGGARLKLSEDYLGKEDHEFIDASVIKLIRTWYLAKGDDGRSVTEYEGIHLGSLSEFDFHDYLIFRIKNLEVMKKIVDEEKPRQIIVIEDTGELIDVAKLVGAAYGIKIMTINLKPAMEFFRDVIARMKDNISDIVYFSIFDLLVRIFLLKNAPDDMVLIDPRAHALLMEPHGIEKYTFFPVEKGVANRRYAFDKERLYVSFDVPVFGHTATDIKKQSDDLRVKWKRLANDPSFKDRFIYKGINIWLLVDKKLSEFFNKRFPLILSVMAQVKYIHDRKRIKTIIFRGDGREKEKAIITAAKMLRIPTIYITHGVLAENTGHDILYCTKTAVWGQADFDRYVSLGNPPERVAITGSPKYDRALKGGAFMPPEEVYKSIGLKPDKPFIILATQPVRKFSSYNIYDEREVLARSTLNAISQLPDIRLVIKLHPFDDYDMYKRILKETAALDVSLIRDIDSLSLIRAGSLLMTFNSTMALEAMMLDKPVIIINLWKREDTLPFVAKGGAIGVYDSGALAGAINLALNDPATSQRLKAGRKETVSYYLHKLDGRSSWRVGELINGVISAKYENN